LLDWGEVDALLAKWVADLPPLLAGKTVEELAGILAEYRDA
jgi:hypothetical protein